MIRKIDTAAKFIKVSLKADGTIYQSSRSQVKSGEDFAALMMHIDGILQHTGQQILNGETKAPVPSGRTEGGLYLLFVPSGMSV